MWGKVPSEARAMQAPECMTKPVGKGRWKEGQESERNNNKKTGDSLKKD